MARFPIVRRRSIPLEVSLLLKFLAPFLLAAACWAQEGAGKQIKITVLAGEGSTNNVARRVAAAPIVEVADDTGKPVAGAQVTFETPRTGPTATFFGEMYRNTVTTDDKGQAKVLSLTPNDTLGKFRIFVRATSGNSFAETTINQTNSQGPGSGPAATAKNKSLWTKVLIIGAAAAIGGGVAASRGSDNNTSAAAAKRPITIGAGPITVGGPR